MLIELDTIVVILLFPLEIVADPWIPVPVELIEFCSGPGELCVRLLVCVEEEIELSPWVLDSVEVVEFCIWLLV